MTDDAPDGLFRATLVIKYSDSWFVAAPGSSIGFDLFLACQPN